MDVHHNLVHDCKKYHKELTVFENCQLLCRKCHASGYWNGREGRELFWRAQCRRYGESYMREWLAALPIRVKPIF
jgi:5-methylcytosine-specific restriction endonuclease McrA